MGKKSASILISVNEVSINQDARIWRLDLLLINAEASCNLLRPQSHNVYTASDDVLTWVTIIPKWARQINAEAEMQMPVIHAGRTQIANC